MRALHRFGSPRPNAGEESGVRGLGTPHRFQNLARRAMPDEDRQALVVTGWLSPSPPEAVKKSSKCPETVPLGQGGLQGVFGAATPRLIQQRLPPSSPPLEKGGRSETHSLVLHLQFLHSSLPGGDSV